MHPLFAYVMLMLISLCHLPLHLRCKCYAICLLMLCDNAVIIILKLILCDMSSCLLHIVYVCNNHAIKTRVTNIQGDYCNKFDQPFDLMVSIPKFRRFRKI